MLLVLRDYEERLCDAVFEQRSRKIKKRRRIKRDVCVVVVLRVDSLCLVVLLVVSGFVFDC